MGVSWRQPPLRRPVKGKNAGRDPWDDTEAEVRAIRRQQEALAREQTERIQRLRSQDWTEEGEA